MVIARFIAWRTRIVRRMVSRSHHGRGPSVALLIAALLLALSAIVGAWWSSRDTPSIAPGLRGDGLAGSGDAGSGVLPDAADGDAIEAQRTDATAAAIAGARDARPTPWLKDAPTPAAERRSPASVIELRGQLVNEHGRKLDEEQLRAAAAGEFPRVWLTQHQRRFAEFGRTPAGSLRVEFVPPIDRTGFAAEVTIGARRFATSVDPEEPAPFQLRIEFSAIEAASSAATIVIRPAPQTVNANDRFVTLYRGAVRRAATIEDAGRARFATLDAGRWRGVVCIEGALPMEFDLELGERDDRELLVELQPGFRIVGEAAWDGLEVRLPPAVVVAERVEAVGATAIERARLQGAFVALGGDGSFELGPLPAGEWRLQMLRKDGVVAVLHEQVVVLGGREVEHVSWRIAPVRPPTRIVRLLLEWPATQPRDSQSLFVAARGLVATFLGADGAVVGRGMIDPGASAVPQLELPLGATALELVWRDQTGGLLLDSDVGITHVALPRVVQEGKSQDLKVTLATAPRD